MEYIIEKHIKTILVDLSLVSLVFKFFHFLQVMTEFLPSLNNFVCMINIYRCHGHHCGLLIFDFFFMQLWQIHNAEQMILDDLEANPDKYKGKKLSELTDDEDFDEENSVIHTKAYYKKTLLPKVILVSTFLQSLY